MDMSMYKTPFALRAKDSGFVANPGCFDDEKKIVMKRAIVQLLLKC